MCITASVNPSLKIKLKGIDKKNYDYAMELKKQGKLDEAERVLLHSCQQPSILYKHCYQLFIIWRVRNKNDLRNWQYTKIIHRIRVMIAINNQMIAGLMQHCHTNYNQMLPAAYFDIYSNFLVCDAEMLRRAAEAANDIENLKLAVELINEFINKKKLKSKD